MAHGCARTVSTRGLDGRRTMGAMAFPLPSPSAVFELGRYAAGQLLESAAALATVPVRVIGVLGQAELLVTRITLIAEQAESLVQRVASVAADAEATILQTRAVAAEAARVVTDAAAITGAASAVVTDATVITGAANEVVADAAAITGAASAVVGQAGAAAAEAGALLDGYAPMLRDASPLAARFVAELSPDEVTAAIRMVDELPKLREHLVDDVMPLLGKLDQVGPDLHKLLEVTEDLHLAIAGLPGLKLLRRRGEERTAE
jgi:hypothetical protein